MSKEDSNLNNRETRDRLALTGLAADRETTIESCPDDERFAEFLEADPSSPEQQSFIEHLATCESCRQKWLILSEELDEIVGERAKTGTWFSNRGLLSLVGSAGALAAGVMLYLAIDYRPVQIDGGSSRPPERVLEAPADKELQQVTETGAETFARKKSELNKLSETDTSVPVTGAVSDRRESRVQMSAELSSKPASDSTESLGIRPSSQQADQPYELEGFSANQGELKFYVLLRSFMDSFASLCESWEAGGYEGGDFADTAEQGRVLLEFEMNMEIPYNEFIKEIVQLLAQKEPVKDTELDNLCRQAGKVTAEMDKAGH